MSKKGGFNGMPGNMNNLVKQAQRMQRQMEEAQKELETREFEGSAGGGVVKAYVSGAKQLLRVEFKPEVVEPDDIEMLQDLVVAAVNEAMKEVEAAQAQSMGALTGGLGGGLNLPGLF